jgi:thiol-disulfide isomerase/thioredoxin
MKSRSLSLSFCLLAIALLLLATLSRAVDQRKDKPSNDRCAVNVGDKAPPIQIQYQHPKKLIKFPDDYKGKVVLIDFWATWCPPCREELPNVVSTYQKYHAKGFEIIGISLDRAEDASQFGQFTKDHNMTWPQMFEGKFWQSSVALKYGVHAIPCPVLVDGDTGTVLAVAPDTLGEDLGVLIEKALAAKKSK